MQPERRFTSASARVERRAVDGVEVPVLRGHAAVFDQWTTLYEGRYWTWKEVVRRGAFASAIAERQDVVGLFNHDRNYVLARTSSGTLALEEDARGLADSYELLDSQSNRDLVIGPVERGDISGQSFAFLPRNKGDEVVTRREDGSVLIERPGERVTLRMEGDLLIEERELLSVDLFDVSVVTTPAYSGTDVGLRSAMIGPFNPEARTAEARTLLDTVGRRRRRSLLLMDLDLRLAGAGAANHHRHS